MNRKIQYRIADDVRLKIGEERWSMKNILCKRPSH